MMILEEEMVIMYKLVDIPVNVYAEADYYMCGEPGMGVGVDVSMNIVKITDRNGKDITAKYKAREPKQYKVLIDEVEQMIAGDVLEHYA